MNLLAVRLRRGAARALKVCLKPVHRRRSMLFPTFDRGLHESLLLERDYFRYATMGLAVSRVMTEGIEGALAEVGVYRGDMSRFLHALAPERALYLFDSFEGFAPADCAAGGRDTRFRDTSAEFVLRNIGDARNVVLKPGFVPATFAGLEGERFSFVLVDLDKFQPTLASLEFFYPRLSPGGYLIVHDYNSPESDRGASRALDGFLAGKPERIVDIADIGGSAVIRKA